MELRVRETSQVITDSELRSLHPNTSFPQVLTSDILESFGVDPILEGPQAITIPPYEISVRQGVEEINSQWFTKYVVGPIFDTEEQEVEYKVGIDNKAAENVRTQRDKLLQETDWTQNRDVTLSNDIEWVAYRQELRDITLQEGFPHNITWPEKP